MKYKVVGWTWFNNPNVPYVDNIGFAERNAVIDEIRKHQYLFSGREHQEDYAPVFNDGKMRCFSQRGWGSIMAESYNCMKKYDYSAFAYGVNSKYRKTPDDVEDSYFLEDDFVPETNLNEDFIVAVKEDIFDLAKSRNPVYMEDLEELRMIDAGDRLILTCNDKRETYLVSDVNRNRNVKRSNLKYNIKGKYKLIISYIK